MTLVSTAAKGGGGAATLIGSVSLLADQASFDTNTILPGNIPSSYKHLLIELLVRTDRAATTDNIVVQFNGDSTSANYKTERLDATIAAVAADLQNGTQPGVLANSCTGSTAPANSFTACFLNVVGYQSGALKMVTSTAHLYYDTTPTVQASVHGGVWLNTAAVTRIVVLPLIGTNWKAGSVFSLYGLA